jgi:hypothetical protein
MQTRHRFWQIIALVILIAGLLGIVQVSRGDVHWKNEVGIEGLIALFAAVIAFVALMIQLEEERNAKTEERERQNNAVARAILFEVDGFCATYLSQPRDLLMQKDINIDRLPRFASVGPNQFPVYRGNAGRIGELPTECVLATVGFFRVADSILSNLVDYTISLD